MNDEESEARWEIVSDTGVMVGWYSDVVFRGELFRAYPRSAIRRGQVRAQRIPWLEGNVFMRGYRTPWKKAR